MQSSIPGRFQDALDAQCCREDRQDFLLDLIETEVLPKIPADHRGPMLHVGANRCHLADRLGEYFQAVHVIEPNTYQLPDAEDLQFMVVHTEGLMSVNIPCWERFSLVLCDHLLHTLAVSPARAQPQDYIHRLVTELLMEGGVAVIGTLAPRGPLHHFMAAVNPAYVGSAQVQQILKTLPGVRFWVVERSNTATLPSASLLRLLLEMHAYLAQQQAELAAPSRQPAIQLANGVCEGLGSRSPPTQHGSAGSLPSPGSMPSTSQGGEGGVGGGQGGASGIGVAGGGGGLLDPEGIQQLIRQYVEEASDGTGRYNWVEEDDVILVLKQEGTTAEKEGTAGLLEG